MKASAHRLLSAIKLRMNHLSRAPEKSVSQLILFRCFKYAKSVIFMIRYGAEMRRSRSRLTDLKAKRARKTFVFANGPSLKDLDFSKIAELVKTGEFDLIVLNSFASKMIGQQEIRPTLSVFADPAHFFGPKRAVIRDQVEGDIRAVNDAGCLTLIPEKYHHASRFKHSIQFCSSYDHFRKNMKDLTRPMGHYGSTAMVALSAALHLDYEEIFICGYDNSNFLNFRVDEQGEKYFQDRHFYDSGSDDAPKVVLPRERYGPSSSIFHDFAQSFYALEKFAASVGDRQQIFNIAKDTYTDAFPRMTDLDVYQKTP